MKKLFSLLEQFNWALVLVLCATLGLAPFAPPHVVEKISMLIQGSLIAPVDWFDLALHGFPWVILILKILLQWLPGANERGATSISKGNGSDESQ